MLLNNYHIHTNFCDGKASVPEIILKAEEYKMNHIGFSSHAPLPFSCSWSLSNEDVLNLYCSEVRKFKNQSRQVGTDLHIFLGIEHDYIPGYTIPFSERIKHHHFDYIIGSVHLVRVRNSNNFWFIDGKRNNFIKELKDYFNNDIKSGVNSYYSQLREMISTQQFDIIGHLDKIKLNNANEFFSENEQWYINEVEETLEIAKKYNKIIELNTRGFYQKKCEEFYPSNWILKRIFELNIPVVVSSDAHQTNELTAGYSEAYKTLSEIGFKSVKQYCNNEWIDV